MAYKGAILGTCKQGAEMLESESIQELFTLRRLGWGTKRIAKELGVSPGPPHVPIIEMKHAM